ncbi:MAG TPA: DUF3052 family protein [Dehalococcoidia bacterium]|nr:DUF3052 family protein [Dehalococcoidia bacterium]
MAEKDYSHRRVVDKLGVKPGHLLAFDEAAFPLEPLLRYEAEEQAGGVKAGSKATDVVLATVDAETDAVGLLLSWKERIQPAGGIWLLSPKRSQPGYVDQNELIEAGKAAGLVDNKVCSVSDTVSAMRFVIRRSDRPG